MLTCLITDLFISFLKKKFSTVQLKIIFEYSISLEGKGLIYSWIFNIHNGKK